MKTQKYPLAFLISALSFSVLPAQAGYDDLIRETMDQAKQECANKGWAFQQNGNGSTCTPPNTNGRAIGQEVGGGQLSSPVVQERMNAGIVRDGATNPSGPIADTLPPNDDPRCESYARAAVADVRTMNQAINYHPECRTGGPRWDPNYQSHYKWCLTVPDAATMNEANERRKHLVRFCGSGNL